MKVEDVLRQVGIPYLQHGSHHHTTPNRLQIDCPYCSPRSRRWRMGVRKDRNAAACWTCGWYKFTDVLIQITGLDYRKVKALLDPVVFVQGKRVQQTQRKLVVPKALTDLLPIHRDYLGDRGYDPDELVKLWKIQGIGLTAQLAWRIFIPIFLDGEMVSWTTRAPADDVTKRYINASTEEEAYPAKKLLPGEEYCNNCIIVHEGPFDAFRTGPGSTWLGGLEYTRSQILRISKYPVRVICLDNHPEAQKVAKKICASLEAFPGETHRVVLEGKDPGSAPDHEIKELRRRFLDA